MDIHLRKKWCRQTAQSIAYLHKHGVIHSDLRPEKFLVHTASEGSLDLWVCDFGGSTCEELNLDGGRVPDDPFFDPTLGFISVPATDIFSLGSIFYTILTVHWPYRSRGPFKAPEELCDYQSKVNILFSEGKFPDVTGLVSGKVVLGCWTQNNSTVRDVLQAFEVEMPPESSNIWRQTKIQALELAE